MKYGFHLPGPRLAAWGLGLALTASGAWAQDLPQEFEPNPSCAAAQDLTRSPLPLQLDGSLDTRPEVEDVDFYRLTAAPGDLVRINVDGQLHSPLTLEDPLLGVYDSSCNLITVSDDWYGTEPQTFVEAPPDGILIAAITSNYDWDFTGDGVWRGSYRLRVQREALARSISGGVVNARTGLPLASANVSIQRCVPYSCENAGATSTDESGAFRFATGLWTTQGPLAAGTYRLTVHRYNYLLHESEPFAVAEGEDLDLGAIALTPEPAVGSLRGRVADLITGAPLSGAGESRAWVEIQSCSGEDATLGCWRMADLPVEADGSFQLVSQPDGTLPPPGWYRAVAYAEQYEGAQGTVVYIGDGQHQDLGELRLKSYPVRIYLAQGCGAIPSTGGRCAYQAKLVNGTAGRLQADAWSVIQANRGLYGNLTTFQTDKPRAVNLAPGASVLLPYEFFVPAGVEDYTSICGQAVASPRANPFETFGSRYLFCLSKGVTGFTVVPEGQKQEAVKKLLGHTPR